MRRGSGWLALLGALSLCLPLACGPAESVEAPRSGRVAAERRPAPDFELRRLDGGTVDLASLRGKTVVLDFWATWCPPCEFQVPELNAFYDAHREDTDVVVLGISVDTEPPEEVAKWVSEKEVRYPILLGDEDLARRFGALGFPTLFVIGRDGNIEAQHVGLIERDDLERELARQRATATMDL